MDELKTVGEMETTDRNNNIVDIQTHRQTDKHRQIDRQTDIQTD